MKLPDQLAKDFDNEQLKQLEQGDSKEKIFAFPEIVRGNRIEEKILPLPVENIRGILARNEKGELAGGSKSFKTWTLIHQALAIASGLDWWSFETEKTNVIFLNLEIPPPFFEARVRAVAHALEIKVPDNFYVWHLRNAKLGTPERWNLFLAELKAKCLKIEHPFLTSDPIYKLLGGRNENSAGDVAQLLEQLDDMVEATDGSNFFGHHYAKGGAAKKEPIDRASGSGVFQRDPDTIFTMTPHEKAGCFVVDAILRNHPPVEPFVVEWRYPLFKRLDGVDPTALKQRGVQKHYSSTLLSKWLGTDQLPTKQFLRRLKEETGMSESTFYKLLDQAEQEKLIARDGIANTWERV